MNPADPLAPLLAAVASCDSAFRLLELLMQFCRDQAAAYRNWEEDITRQNELPTAVSQAKQVVADIGIVFTPDDAPEALDAIRSAVAGFLQQGAPPPVVRAELLLRELDRTLTPQLRQLYPEFHSGPLAPDRLFPVYWPNLKRNGWLPDDKLSTAPRSLSQPPGFLPYWGLSPPLSTFAGREVEFVFSARSDVSLPIPGPLKLGVGVLNAVPTELVWEELEEPPRFRDVRPHPDLRVTQIAAMRQIATRAADEGVRVLVFPELCVDQAGATEVFAHIAGLSNRPALVVIGSHHWMDGGERRNTCTAIRSGSATPLIHHKVARFSYPKDGKIYWEDIVPGNSMRVYVGTDSSLVLLICRDFLDTSARQLVEVLRPTFLCIPTYSKTSGPFVDSVGALTASAQTVVVFANGPVPDDRVVGAFGVPRTRESHSSGSSLARQVNIPEPLPPLPCLFVYDSNSDAINPLPC